MFDILNEVQYIKDILSNGFSKQWMVDSGIYIRYCKLEGMKKSEAKKKLEEKFEKYVEAYNKYTYYKIIDSIIARNWDNAEPLREIKEIKLSQEILDWFYNNEEISLKEKKILFTFYGWSKIKQYVSPEYYMVHCLNKSLVKFKEEAGLKNSSGLKKKEFLDLYDKKYINVYRSGNTKKINYDCLFMLNIPFINVDESKNPIYINGEENLHKFGNYIEEYLKKSKKEKEVLDKQNLLVYNGKKKKTRCEVCGKEIFVEVKDNKTDKCKECYDQYRKEYYRLSKQKSRRKEDDKE